MKNIAIGLLFILTFTLVSFAQMDKSQRPSPPAQAQCKLADGKTITVDYSSPRMRGRKIFGGLVPYDEIWRAGANEATTFVTTGDLSVGKTKVPAGSYTLFAIPAKEKWTLIISKVTGEWGIPYKDEYKGQELARVPMKVSALASPLEDFTIGFAESKNSCTLQMSWEKTRASAKFIAKK